MLSSLCRCHQNPGDGEIVVIRILMYLDTDDGKNAFKIAEELAHEACLNQFLIPPLSLDLHSVVVSILRKTKIFQYMIRRLGRH